MSLQFVLVGSQIKRFKNVVKSLAAIGSELLVEGLPEKLVLRAINSAHSAFLAVSLSAQFFESYNVFSQRAVVQAGVTIKHLLATFRSVRVNSMSFELNEQQAALRVTLRCENGLLKRYGLDLNKTDILQANLDSQSLPVAVVAEAAELHKLLNNFQSTLDEVTIIALPEQQLQGDSQGQASAQRCVRLQSFFDPSKAAGSKSLHTIMSLDTSHLFKSYSNSCASASDVTINLKDLKALVALCAELGADVMLRFDEAGVPLLAAPHVGGVQQMDYTAELILSTLQESVHTGGNDDDAWAQPPPPQQHANGGQPGAFANGQPGSFAQRAERAETIVQATTAANGAAAGVRGPSAHETPQGGSAAAAAAAAAAAGGGSGGRVVSFRQPQLEGGGAGSGGGGRSGGRSRSGGVSRFEQLEAALAEEEAAQQQQQARVLQQQQQQHRQPVPAFAHPAPPRAAAHQYQQAAAPPPGSTHGGGQVSGGASFMASPDDISALPGRRRSPAPAAAAAAQQAYQQQWQQQQQLWQQQQQQQQPGHDGGDAAMADTGGVADPYELFDDEELAATPPEAGGGTMQDDDDGLGCL